MATSKELKSYQKWSHKECFDIGTIYRSRAVEIKYHAKEKPLNESSVFRLTSCKKKRFQKYEIMLVMLVKKTLAHYHKWDRFFWKIGPRRSDGSKIFSCLSEKTWISVFCHCNISSKSTDCT